MTQSLIESLKETSTKEELSTLSNELLSELHPLPSYSSLSKPAVHTVKTATCGAFGIGYYVDQNQRDPETGRMGATMVVLNKRPNMKDPNAKDMYACTGGGFMELGDEKTAGEQPNVGATRELREETLNDRGTPVLDVAPSRLHLIKTGVDYRNPSLPVHYSGHLFEMSKKEYQAMTEHAAKIESDPAYKEAVSQQTHGEVTGYEIMPLSEAMKLTPEQFAHPHELEVLQQLPEWMTQQQARESAYIG